MTWDAFTKACDKGQPDTALKAHISACHLHGAIDAHEKRLATEAVGELPNHLIGSTLRKRPAAALNYHARQARDAAEFFKVRGREQDADREIARADALEKAALIKPQITDFGGRDSLETEIRAQLAGTTTRRNRRRHVLG